MNTGVKAPARVSLAQMVKARQTPFLSFRLVPRRPGPPSLHCRGATTIYRPTAGSPAAGVGASMARDVVDSEVVESRDALVAWAALAVAAPFIVAAFDARGDSADYVTFYCRAGVVAWLFLACLFVANTAFNNLGFPVMTMAFNWGRATLGTIPFVTFGARYGGVKGGLMGVALGCAVFGLLAVGAAYLATKRLAKGMK